MRRFSTQRATHVNLDGLNNGKYEQHNPTLELVFRPSPISQHWHSFLGVYVEACLRSEASQQFFKGVQCRVQERHEMRRKATSLSQAKAGLCQKLHTGWAGG